MNKIYSVILKCCIFLAISSNAHAQSWNKPLFQDWQPDSGVVGMVYNAMQWHNTKLSSYDQNLHTSAVLLALNRAENGELVEWYSDKGDSTGKVMIVATWNNCRRIHHYIQADRRERSWGETACMNTNTNRWVFTDK
jgi:surface antigen